MHIRKWLFSAVGKPTSLRMGNKKRLISIVKKQNWPGRESGFQTARRVYRKNHLAFARKRYQGVRFKMRKEKLWKLKWHIARNHAPLPGKKTVLSGMIKKSRAGAPGKSAYAHWEKICAGITTEISKKEGKTGKEREEKYICPGGEPWEGMGGFYNEKRRTET